MTTAPVYTHPDYDTNTLAYLQSLQAGQKPDIRPEFGRWEPIIKKAERVFKETPDQAKKGAAVSRLLRQLADMQQYVDLKALLAGEAAKKQAPGQDQQEAVQGDLLDMPALPEEAQLPPAVVALAKAGSPWFDEAIKYGKCASPEGYHGFFEVGATFVLATAAANRIVIPGGPNGQHTGFYGALVARPGCWAKTTTAQAYLNVLRFAGLSWLLRSDQVTPQKLLADMSGRYPPTNYFQLSPELQEWWRLRLAQAGQGGIYRDELGAFFRAMNRANSPQADFRPLLFSFDDRLPSYGNGTRSWGTEEAVLPYLPVLGSTTFADFRTVGKVGSDEWNDGMLSRFVPIAPPPGPALNLPFNFETVPVPVSLSTGLHQMHEWLGYPVINIVEETNEKTKEVKPAIEIVKERPPAREIRPEPEVAAYYHRYRAALRTMESVPEDLASSYVRLPVKALRVAALFAGIECSSVILLRHWAKAQELAENWRLSLHRFYAQINTSRIPTITTLEEKILGYLAKNPKSTARTMYTKLNIDPELAKKAVFNLIQSGDIFEIPTKAGNGRMIKLYSKTEEMH